MGDDDGPMTAHSCFSLRPLPAAKIRDWLLRLGDTGTLYACGPCKADKTCIGYPRVLNLISKFFAAVNSLDLRFGWRTLGTETLVCNQN